MSRSDSSSPIWREVHGERLPQSPEDMHETLSFVSCPADPDIWMGPNKKSDGSTCYDYILLYVDDALVISVLKPKSDKVRQTDCRAEI